MAISGAQKRFRKRQSQQDMEILQIQLEDQDHLINTLLRASERAREFAGIVNEKSGALNRDDSIVYAKLLNDFQRINNIVNNSVEWQLALAS